MDIVERYDGDGVHFDDYFYPNGTPATIDDAAYNADPRGFPATTAGRAEVYWYIGQAGELSALGAHQ